MIGPGKYDFYAQAVIDATGAAGVVLIVMGGKLGHGVSCKVECNPAALAHMPNFLRDVANSLETDLCRAVKLQ